MGMYIDIDYLRIFVGQSELTLASDIEYGTVENEDKLNQCINFAESYVNSCLGNRYKIPITCEFGHSSSMIKQIVADLSRFQYEQLRASVEVAERNTGAISLVDDIASGGKSLRCDFGHPMLLEGNAVFLSSSANPPKERCLCCNNSLLCCSNRFWRC